MGERVNSGNVAYSGEGSMLWEGGVISGRVEYICLKRLVYSGRERYILGG